MRPAGVRFRALPNCITSFGVKQHAMDATSDVALYSIPNLCKELRKNSHSVDPERNYNQTSGHAGIPKNT